MVFHRSLNDSKFPQVSRTLLSILAVLNNAVVWMVSSRPLTSKSSSPFNSPLITVPNAPITIGIIVTFMVHSFFNFLARPRYLFFFSLSFSFILLSAGTVKSTILQVLFFFFLLITIRSDYNLLISFSHQRKLMVFHWSLSDSKSPQVSRCLLSILADLNNAVVWTVSTRLVISKSSSPCINLLVTVPRAPITIGIIVTFMFHRFSNSLVRSSYLSLFSHSFSGQL